VILARLPVGEKGRPFGKRRITGMGQFLLLLINYYQLYNLATHIATSPKPTRCQWLTCGDSLFTFYNCGLKSKFEDLAIHNNYIVYVVEGRKVWHTTHGAYDLQEGSCFFVRKGASIVEQYGGKDFSFFLFFVPDEFICEVVRSRSSPISSVRKKYDPVMRVDNSASISAFFQSMFSYFDEDYTPDPTLLELKFKELILTIAQNPRNSELLAYFRSLLQEPQNISLQKIMDENFQLNMGLEEFAKLGARSLSAFKRDFLRIYNMPPGKWLLEKRLLYAMHLLKHMGKSVTDAASESGFENPSHFSRAFRQRFHTAPGSIKQQVASRSLRVVNISE